MDRKQHLFIDNQLFIHRQLKEVSAHLVWPDQNAFIQRFSFVPQLLALNQESRLTILLQLLQLLLNARQTTNHLSENRNVEIDKEKAFLKLADKSQQLEKWGVILLDAFEPNAGTLSQRFNLFLYFIISLEIPDKI